MNKFYIKYVSVTLLFILTSCSYQPIFSQKSYNFEIEKIKYSGEKQINNIIKKKLNLIKTTYKLIIILDAHLESSKNIHIQSKTLKRL